MWLHINYVITGNVLSWLDYAQLCYIERMWKC